MGYNCKAFTVFGYKLRGRDISGAKATCACGKTSSQIKGKFCAECGTSKDNLKSEPDILNEDERISCMGLPVVLQKTGADREDNEETYFGLVLGETKAMTLSGLARINFQAFAQKLSEVLRMRGIVVVAADFGVYTIKYESC